MMVFVLLDWVVDGDSGAVCGAWSLSLDDASSVRYRAVGGRLLYVPQTKISA